MDKKITPALMRAFDDLKKDLGLPSDYALCKHLSLPRPTLSCWRTGRAKTIKHKWWKKLQPLLEKFMDAENGPKELKKYDVSFAEEVYHVLERGDINLAMSMLKHVIEEK